MLKRLSFPKALRRSRGSKDVVAPAAAAQQRDADTYSEPSPQARTAPLPSLSRPGAQAEHIAVHPPAPTGAHAARSPLPQQRTPQPLPLPMNGAAGPRTAVAAAENGGVGARGPASVPLSAAGVQPATSHGPGRCGALPDYSASPSSPPPSFWHLHRLQAP